jgi:hypothetical protein
VEYNKTLGELQYETTQDNKQRILSIQYKWNTTKRWENCNTTLHKITKQRTLSIQYKWNTTKRWENRHKKLPKIIKQNKENATKDTEHTIQEIDQESTYETHDNKTTKKSKRGALNI